MARYSSSSYRRRRGRSRKWIYIISSLLIFTASYRVYRSAYHTSYTAPELLIDTSIAGETKTKDSNNIEPIEKTPYAEQHTLNSSANPLVDKLIDEAMKSINAKHGGIISARDILNEALPMAMSQQQKAFVKEQLSELADKWLFSRTIFPRDRLCGTYKVASGELLSTIGRQHKVPYQIISQVNRISRPEALRAGQTIKIINGPFHARIHRSTFVMDLYLQNTFVRSFPVGLGQPGMETPTGLWLVKPGGKLISPTWTEPVTGKTYRAEDPAYPLGARWIGLEGITGAAQGRTGFAIHGTKDGEKISTASSRGCIRLYNDDVILVYNSLMPGLSQVEIAE